MEQTRAFRDGVAFAFAAYGFWGVAPVYFSWVEFAAPLEIIAHRILWSVVLLTLLVTLRKQWPAVRNLSGRALSQLLLSGGLIALNWGVFVWALQSDRMVETSLGYFINPLISIALGRLFLGEVLRPLQLGAVLFAALGVLNELWLRGHVPLVALTLAFSFGFYGLVRKQVNVDGAVGLGVETALLAPLALGYLLWQFGGDVPPRDVTGQELALLALGGLVTTFPLVCFGMAAQRLPLAILGIIQFTAPSLTLMLAVFIYDEPFRIEQAVTFGCIWMGVILFSVEGLYHQRRRSRKTLV